ncbi:hypothetical protein VTK26DRAFT_1072 [Humicola hyalothermophila]
MDVANWLNSHLSGQLHVIAEFSGCLLRKVRHVVSGEESLERRIWVLAFGQEWRCLRRVLGAITLSQGFQRREDVVFKKAPGFATSCR